MEKMCATEEKGEKKKKRKRTGTTSPLQVPIISERVGGLKVGRFNLPRFIRNRVGDVNADGNRRVEILSLRNHVGHKRDRMRLLEGGGEGLSVTLGGRRRSSEGDQREIALGRAAKRRSRRFARAGPRNRRRRP